MVFSRYMDLDKYETGFFNEQIIQAIAEQHPSGRIGTPGDIAPVVSFLASDGARWVNGANIMINGVSATFTSSVLSELTIIQGMVV